MLSFPNCKINLGLHIIRKREDGFHDLETIFLPIPLTDVLEIITSDKNEFSITGLQVSHHDNLCSKAYDLLQKDFQQIPPIKMHLHKVIPMGAGLGGGSADASFTLQLLNKKYELNLSDENLKTYALHLGSDCPFFLINKPCFATGRGEILEPINIDLTGYKIVIVNPGIHIDTKWAFSKITPAKKNISLKEIITQPIETWKDQLKNDFELPVFSEYPEIEKIKNILFDNGAVYAAMSGSGSSVFGIFHTKQDIKTEFNKNYFQTIIQL